MKRTQKKCRAARGALIALLSITMACALESSDVDAPSAGPVELGVKTTELDANGNIRVLLIGDSQMKWPAAGYSVQDALNAFAANAHGASNKMVVSLNHKPGQPCSAFANDPQMTTSGGYDFVVFQPPLADADGTQTACWNTMLQHADAANVQLGIMTAHTSQPCFTLTDTCNFVRQGDIALHNLVRDYVASKNATRIPAGQRPLVHIPGSAFLRHSFGSNPQYAALNPWYVQGDGHSSARAVYAYVMAIYNGITGRSTIGGLTSLAGLTGSVATTAEAEQMQRFTTELFGKGPYKAKTLSLGVNQDGRAEVFYTAPDDAPYHTWRTNELNTTAQWLGERLTGRNGNRFRENPLVKRIATAKDSMGRLNVVYIGQNDGIYRMRQDATQTANGLVLAWTDPQYLISNINQAKEVAIATNSNGALEVFYIGTNDNLYHAWQTGPDSFSGENLLGGAAKKAKQFAVARHNSGHLEVFYAGLDNNLYHTWRQANYSWSGQQPFVSSAYQAKRIVAGNNQDGRVEVFYIGTNDRLYHIYWNGVSNSWANEIYLGVSTDTAKRLAVANHADGRLEVVYVGLNDRVYHNTQVAPNGSWTGQSYLGTSGNYGAEISIARDGANLLQVLVVGTDGRLLRFTQTAPNGSWSGEQVVQ